MTKDHWSGGVPPVALKVKLYGWPIVASDKGVVLIVGAVPEFTIRFMLSVTELFWNRSPSPQPCSCPLVSECRRSGSCMCHMRLWD